jgi:hypothetical protein
MNRERTDHTLQATALVHEAYIKLVGDNGPPRTSLRFRPGETTPRLAHPFFCRLDERCRTNFIIRLDACPSVHVSEGKPSLKRAALNARHGETFVRGKKTFAKIERRVRVSYPVCRMTKKAESSCWESSVNLDPNPPSVPCRGETSVTCKLTFLRVPLALALLVALATSPALAQNPKKGSSSQPTYTFDWLDTLGGTQSITSGINNLGDIWGTSTTTPSEDEWNAFIIPGQGEFAGQMINFTEVLLEADYIKPFNWETLTGTSSVGVHEMNDKGQIVGHLQQAVNGDFRQYYYVYRPASSNPFIVIDYIDSSAYGPRIRINNLGVVTGHSGGQSFVWTEEGGLQYLTPLADQMSSNAINLDGIICGSTGGAYAGFAWKYAPQVGFTSLFGSAPYKTTAADINDSGIIVGTYQETRTSFFYGYRMSPSGAYSLFKMPKNYASEFSYINESGAILGRGNINGSWRPILYTDTTGVVDLFRQTVDVPAGITNWGRVVLRGINDQGQIVGTVEAHLTSLGSTNLAFTLTPSK